MTDPAHGVLHVIPRLSTGGASRALIALAKYSTQPGIFRHTVISLSPPDRRALTLASEAGVNVQFTNDIQAVLKTLMDADIVQFHFWNSPEFYELLLSQLPPMRSLLWSHVNGLHSPHVITLELLKMFDTFVASSPNTLNLENVKLAGRRSAELVFAGADFARLEDIQVAHHSMFNVGYIGTIDFAKMHPNFLKISAEIEIPNVRFILCGAGNATKTIKRQTLENRVEERFEFFGYVEDIRAVLARLDVFGYPLCQDNYSTSELVMQEAMYAGIPPVVLPFGGAPHLIVHGESGLVARDEKEYARAIEFLYKNPSERFRLGRNAAVRARQLFGARNCAERFNYIYSRVLEIPKRMPPALHDMTANEDPITELNLGAALLIRSLGDEAADFRISLSTVEENMVLAAEGRIATATPALADCILHYLNHFPNDGHLALWSGLVLLNRNRPALATAAFSRAIDLGRDHWRVHWYLARAARAAGSSALANAALAVVHSTASQFVAELVP